MRKGQVIRPNAPLKGVFNSYRSSARKRKRAFELSFAEFLALAASNCFYCGGAPASKCHQVVNVNGRSVTNYGRWLLYNGVDRIDNEKGYEPGNCVACCSICNLAKRTMTLADFYSWVDRIYHNRLFA